MYGRRVMSCAAALLLFAAAAMATTIDVSQPVKVTDSTYYERGQSIIYDGSNYWLFYGRSATCTDPYSSGNPDIHDYAIYYKKAASVPGLAAATAVAVPGATNCYLGETGAALVDGNVWTFGTVPSVGFPGAKSLYGWYTGDAGTSWTQVADLWDDMPNGAAHHSETGFDSNGKLYIMANYPESYSGWYTKWTDDPTAGSITWSTPIPLNTTTNHVNGTGHFYVEGGGLYIGLMRTSPSQVNYVLEYVASPEGWTELCNAASTAYDPTLFKVGSTYVYAQAPYVAPSQYIIAWSGSSLNNVLSGSSVPVTEGGYGTNGWVDMWPVGFTAGSTSYLFYTSERKDPDAEGTGNIWYLEFDWDPSFDHYTYIQEAIDGATGTTISVGAGTYTEQVTIDKSLDLIGAGETTTTIEAPAADRAGSVVEGTKTWDYIVAAYPTTGTIDVRIEGFTIDGAGENWSTGTNGFAGVFFRDVDGATAGLYASTIQNFAATEYESWGVWVCGDSDLTIYDNTLTDYTRDGIVVNGDGGANPDPVAVVDDNDLTGSGLCLNGIQVGRGAAATVTDNTVRDHTRSSPWAAVGIMAYQSDGVTIGTVGAGNTVTNCKYGMMLVQSDGSSITGNTLTDNLSFDIGIDDSDNNTVSANTITATTTVPDKAVGISNGSTGNMIGGPTAADGNTITMPTAGASLLYGIYVQGTVGSGSNTVQNNTFTGSTRFVQVDGGNSGTMTVADNTVSGCSFAGVFLNAGSAVITGNTLTNTVRPIEFWGAANVTIENNYIDGATFDGINAGFFTGTVTVTENSFLNSTGRSLNNRTTTPIDASENYWGVVTASGVADEIDGDAYVDYTPWLGGGTATSPGFTGDYSTLYVDDDGAQTGSGGRIQEGVDLVTASTVNVAPGTYPDPITIPGSKPLTLTGAGVTQTFLTQGMLLSDGVDQLTLEQLALSGLGAAGAVIRAGHPNNDFTMDHVLIDGEGGTYPTRSSYAGGRLTGDVTVTNCEFKDVAGWSVFDSASSGWETVMGTVTFAYNYIHECDGAVAFRGDNGDRIDLVSAHHNVWVNINDNWNPHPTAQNAWACFETHGVEVLEFYANTMTHVNENQWGEGQGLQTWRVGDVDVHNNLFDDCWQGIWLPGLGTEPAPTGSVHHNSFTSIGDYAVFTTHGGGGFTSGILDAEMNWWDDASGPSGVGPGTGEPVSAEVDYDPWIGKTGEGYNVVCDPDPLIINVASLPNDPDGQIAVKYLGGGGGLVYGYSVKFTWDSGVATTAFGDVAQGNLLSDAGATTFLRYSSGANEITVDCALLGAVGGVTGPGTMFTIDFDANAFGTSPVNITLIAFRDNANNPLSGFFEDDGEIQVDITNPSVTGVAIENLTLAHTNEYAKNTDNLELTATVTDDYALTAADIVADLSTLLAAGGLAVPAQSYVSPNATWTLPLANVTLTADGLKTVTVTATDGLGNSASDTDDITADNTPPGKVTGFASAPAHEEGILSWTDPTSPSLDTNYYGIVVRYDAWGDYPYYDTGAPAYPPTYTGGDGEAFNGLGAVTGGVHAIVPRDIHYYSAFAYDWALNYGGVDAGGQDRCTNYWLGDVASGWGVWGYNGLVNVNDIDKLGGTYGAAPPVGFNNSECDVGPTDDNSRVGIPEPDDSIGFEDLMIFAMNFGVVAPRVVPFLPDEATKALSLELAELGAIEDGMFEIALRLEGNASEVKGLSTVIAYGSSDLEFVNARLSDDMSSPLAPVFFWHGSDDESVQIDLAVLGTDVTVGGSGEVAIMTFRALAGEYALEFESADLRGAENENLMAELEGIESKPEVPAAFRLVGNLPNPFNPMTKVAYQVPHESHVSIRVYDVSGRLVRTLVDGSMDPGHHEVTWDGRNDRGEHVGSGVYFCTMDAGDFHGSHKMMLLK